MDKTIKAFGKRINRAQAHQIIINDHICEVVYARNTEFLEDLLIYGWKSLPEWTNEELEEYISQLLIENQPDRKI